jgi:hypothetical protein
MKGLVRKDLYVLTRQMRIFLLFIVVFALLPGNGMTVFAVVYAAMMPYTAIAYDERSKWDQLACTMPYSVRDLVLSKYVLGWLFTAGAAVVSLAANLIERRFLENTGSPLVVMMSFCAGLIMMAVTLPPMFRFGVEKGRMLFIIVMVAAVCGSAELVNGLMETPSAAPILPLLKLVLPAAAIILSLLSVPLSMKLYKKRTF